MTIEIGVLIAITVGVVEVLKKADKLPKKYIPLLAVIIGTLITQIASFDQLGGIVTGLIVGLSAIGLYSGSKSTFLKK
ncbi:MAG: holin [Patescibacteria group bacterium]|nr:holin [Patescibacteria group bacterium]